VADIDGDGAIDTVELTAGQTDPYTQQAEVHFGLWPLLRPEPQSQADIDLGQVTVGATSGERTITFLNDGPDTATNLVVLADGDVEDFTSATDTCSGETLAVDETCVLGVRFTPRQTGGRGLVLAVAGEESDEVEWSPVFAGTGVAPGSDGGSTTPPPPVGSPPPPAGTATRVGKPRVLPARRRARVRTGWTGACAAGTPPCSVEISIAASAGGTARAS
jgi:hypothetical protein